MPFQPGQTGNAGGRPTRYNKAQSLAREHAEEAITKLVEVMRQGSMGEARRAAVDLLDRGFGKPKETHEITGEDGAALFDPDLAKLSPETLNELLAISEQLASSPDDGAGEPGETPA